MTWDIEFQDDFDTEFDDLPVPVQTELLARARVLEQFGPMLGRPSVDTLNGSAYPDMKELRFKADGGAWRVAFAFDPRRTAILLCAGDEQGEDQRRFCENLIAIADRRFRAHLDKLNEPRGSRHG